MIEPLLNLPSDGLAELVADSEQGGWRFVRRLIEEWRSGLNRFDRPGEGLFAARRDGRVVGVCGLNIDPHAGHVRVGRLRHLYVLSSYRRRGVGRELVQAIIAAARQSFDRVHLRTENEEAARLYEAIGFSRCAGSADHTHALVLNGASAEKAESQPSS